MTFSGEKTSVIIKKRNINKYTFFNIILRRKNENKSERNYFWFLITQQPSISLNLSYITIKQTYIHTHTAKQEKIKSKYYFLFSLFQIKKQF